MVLGKEEVLFNNGEKKEITINRISNRKIKSLKALYMKVRKIVPEGTTGIKSLEGDFDFETLSFKLVEEGIKPIDYDELDYDECDRIYNKYFARYAQPQKSEEEKKS